LMVWVWESIFCHGIRLVPALQTHSGGSKIERESVVSGR
jgi:hypothetical protein